MKIALLNPCYWPEVRRGSERVIHELARQLQRNGHGVRLITAHPGAPSRGVEEGLDIVRLPRALDGYLRRRMVQEYLTHVPFAYAALRAGADDVAHACYLTDAAAALRWSGATGRPTVFSYNGVPQRYVFASRRLRLKLLAQAVSGSDAVVMPSHAAAREMRRWFGVDSHVIHPGVDCDAFRSAAPRAEEPTIICAAPWEDGRKRVPLLVEALAHVRRSRPDARLLLLRPVDAATAERLQSEPGVELFDPVEQPADLAPLYGRAWVSALASYNEAFGLVLVEALACGTPVVGSDDAGVPEIIDRSEVGRLFRGSEPTEVARALLEALDLAEQPETAEACRRSALRFSSRRCAEQHEALYREVIQARAGRYSRAA